MPIKKSKIINLLPQEEFEGSTTGRVLKWALSTFRVMVIITELIVMGAFLSRFWFDSRNSDLDDEINSSKAQVLAYSDIETEFRLNQKKLNIAKSLYSEPELDGLFTNVSKLMPIDVNLQSVLISNNDLTIKAQSLSEQSIVQFLINLEDYKALEDINLAQISSSQDNSAITIFSINAKIVSNQLERSK